MSVLFCLDCKKQMELRNGFYSIYYQCPNCNNRFTIHDANILDEIEKQGIFQTSRMSGFVIYDNKTKLIYARRRKNEDEV